MSIELQRLKILVDGAIALSESSLIDMTAAEVAHFRAEHPDCDLLLGGEFEVRCVKKKHGHTFIRERIVL